MSRFIFFRIIKFVLISETESPPSYWWICGRKSGQN